MYYSVFNLVNGNQIDNCYCIGHMYKCTFHSGHIEVLHLFGLIDYQCYN